MRVFSLTLKNFRCFDSSSFSFSDKTVITGKNGSGKTAAIEAVYFSVNGKSFRTPEKKEMIQAGSPYFYIETKSEDDFGWAKVISWGVSRDGVKKITIDGENSTRKEIIKAFSTVVYSPDDIEIIEGSPSRRRDFLDRIIFLKDREFLSTVINYQSYLKHKKVLLKQGDKKGIHYLNRAVIPYIYKIREGRKTVMQEIISLSKSIMDIMNMSFNISFSFPGEDIERLLHDKMEYEIERGYPVVGPHTDQINLKVFNRKGRSISMGEKAFISLIFRLSEVELLKKERIIPLFIADDITGFMDHEKSEKILSYASSMDSQCIISGISFSNEIKKWEYIPLEGVYNR